MQHVQLVSDAPRWATRHGNIWQTVWQLSDCVAQTEADWMTAALCTSTDWGGVERITNKRPSLSSHYKPQEKRGRGSEWGGNRTRLFSSTSQRSDRQYSRLMRWDRANTNEYQPQPNLFCLRLETICDCMLIIILSCLRLLAYLVHVARWKHRQGRPNWKYHTDCDISSLPAGMQAQGKQKMESDSTWLKWCYLSGQ